ncbi:beta-ketoacyl synthase N-terminal-like domain-containing protein [Streptomyces sp. NPDC001262]|uniref:type I polyketide synthase n=1 Tax=Streptomyces sp. NPDC001262 TaxID=3364552 RepID=UPI0036A338AC
MAVTVHDYLVAPSDTTTDGPGPTTLPQVFAAAADAHGDAPAVVGCGEPRSWSQWHAESRALAAGLQSFGIGVGDVVAVHLPNCREFVVTHTAAAEAGAVLLPLHPAYGERDLLTLMRRAGARVLVLPADHRQVDGVALGRRLLDRVDALELVLLVGETRPVAPAEAGRAGRDARIVPYDALVAAHRLASPRRVELTAEMPFVLVPSSGTTSDRPKLCLHSHGTLLSNAATVALDGGVSGGDTIVSASPFTHLFGLLSVHLALLTGCRQGLLPQWDAEAFRALAHRAEANVLFAVPAQLRDLAAALRGDRAVAGRLRLREVRTGGAAVPGPLVADMRRLTGATVIVQWGMSELGAGTVTRPADPPETAVGSIGRPLSGCDARVVDDTGALCHEGVTGELQYRGPHMFLGYLGDRERTREAFTADGWLRTGDLARRNADGTLTHRGRDAEVINVGGVKVSASDIETLLGDLPQFAGLAVTARPDARLGQYPCLIAALQPGAAIGLEEVRAHLAGKGAAELQQPLELLLVDEIPLTPTGKIARGRVAELLARPPQARTRRRADPAALHGREALDAARELIRQEVARVLPAEAAGEPAPDRTFRASGVGSLAAVRLAVSLSEATGLPLPTTIVFDHPTPGELACHLVELATGRRAERTGREEPCPAPESDGSDPVVITGIGCRFPGDVRSAEGLWQLLVDGRETAGPFPDDRGWDLDRLRHPDPAHPGRSSTHYGHFLAGAAEFDARFFGISPREALAMDPQQRLLLETSWEALENAGIDPTALRGSGTAVFIGLMAPDYAPRLAEAPERFDGLLLTGNAPSVASGRIAYTLGLTGPALTVDTACSSSLVAVHLAVQALRRGECSLALAGGATVVATPASFVDFSRQGALAPDGRCKAFAASADGAAWAEGAGVLVLERLSRARRHGHPVLAVIAGSAMNQDGASNGLTAPNGLAQQRVIRQALADAELAAGQIDVVEAHGTGTPLGDRIEAGALYAVHGGGRDEGRPLWLGSVKSNIGHTQAAAGVAGIIKTVQALRHGLLPRTLHTDLESPPVAEGAGDVRLLLTPRAWPRSGRIRRAGVSAFGISGTNAHVILEEAPLEQPLPVAAPAEDEDRPTGDRALPWVLSARSAPALREMALRLVPVAESADVFPAGRALVTSRPSFEHRAVVVARQRAELLAGLNGIADGSLPAHVTGGLVRSEAGGTVFVFPGQGSQWEGMAADLLTESKVFERSLAACEEALAPHIDWSVRAVLRRESGQPPLSRVDVAQTSLFAVMVALSALWQSLGVRPDAVVGHSQGEIAAAHVCGALSLADAAKVVARRAAAVRELPSGRMAAVALPRDEVRDRLAVNQGRLWLAADNGPRSCVMSGDPGAVGALLDELGDQGLRATGLAVDYASHSAHVDVLQDHLSTALDGLEPRPAQTRFYSTVEPGPLDTTRLTSEYWYRNLRRPVEFHRAVRMLLDEGFTRFIEVSPHPVLTYPILDTAESAERPVFAVGSLRRDEGDERRFLLSAAEAFSNGVPVAWKNIFTGPEARHVELPSYPFLRERHWLPTGAAAAQPLRPLEQTPETAASHRPVDEMPLPSSETALLTLVRDHAAVVLGHRDGRQIDPDTAFAEIGTGSLAAVELRARLARALDLPLPSTVVLDHRTPRALGTHLWRLVRDKVQPQPGRRAPREIPDTLDALYRQACLTGQGRPAVELISAAARLRRTFDAGSAPEHAPRAVRLGPAGANHPLLCFPSLLPASGPHEYAPLAEALQGDREVFVLPQPGFAEDEPLPRGLDALTTAHATAVGRCTGAKPFLLCGHSSGGLIAHAVATRLQELGSPAAGLVLLDTPWPDQAFHDEVLPHVLGVAAVRQRDFTAHGIPAHRLTATGGYLRALTGWQPAPISTPTLLLRARQTLPEFASDDRWARPWQLPHTQRTVPGDHFTMLDTHASALADAVRTWWPETADRS